MKYLVAVLSVFIGFSSFAQKTKWSAVHLDNGSIVRGILLENDNDKIKLETYDKSIWVFNKKEVVKVEEVKKFKNSDRIEVKGKGYYNITDIGIMPGNRSHYYSSVTIPSFLVINGYKFNRLLSAGIGAGFESVNSETLIPVFGDVRFDLLKNTFTPFVSIQGGYSMPISWSSDDYYSSYKYYGGLMLNASVGIKKYLTQDVAIVTSFGLRHQQTRTTYTYNNGWEPAYSYDTDTKNIYNKLAIRIGLLFN